MFPILLTTPYFTITSLGIAYMLALLLGILLLSHTASRRQLDLQFIVDHFWSLFLLTLIGARLESVIENYPAFSTEPGLIFYGFSVGGLGFWGGVIFFLLTLTIHCFRHKESLLRWLDTFAITSMPVLTIAYLGHFLNGSSYGTPTSLPWGIAFENIAIPYTIPIHPLQLYLSLLAFLGFWFALSLTKRKFCPGLLGLIILIYWSTARFTLDFLRGDATLMFSSLRLSQHLTILTVILTTALFILYNLKPKK